MINFILRYGTNFFWILFHITLGALCTLTPWVLIPWFYLVLLTSITSLVKKTEGAFILLVYLIAYLASFELLDRMSGTSPFIPYELGKYLMLLLLMFGIFKGYRQGHIGWLMFLLLLPSAFFEMEGESKFRNIVFNLVGPVNVALAVIFFKDQEIEHEDLQGILRFMLYPIISVLAFVIIKTPDIEKVEFTLSSNFEAAGGFGTNQVSTVLGLGAFLVFLFWYKKWTLTGYRWLDMIFFLLFTFRGLVTFSRGGMIVAVLSIFLFLLLDRKFSYEMRAFNPVKIFFSSIPVFIFLIITFIYANRLTGGLLSQRYRGETYGTLSGRKEKTLDVITSNRIQIFMDDIRLWSKHPLFGVGVGASSQMRENSRGFLSHVEISRLLSEHGALGFVYTIILLFLGMSIYRQQRYGSYGIILFTLYIFALFTTFHSAMRTYVSPLLFGLSMIIVNEELDEVNY